MVCRPSPSMPRDRGVLAVSAAAPHARSRPHGGADAARRSATTGSTCSGCPSAGSSPSSSPTRLPQRVRRLVLAATVAGVPFLGGVPGHPAPCSPWPPRAATSRRTTTAESPERSTAARPAATPSGAPRLDRAVLRAPSLGGLPRPALRHQLLDRPAVAVASAATHPGPRRRRRPDRPRRQRPDPRPAHPRCPAPGDPGAATCSSGAADRDRSACRRLPPTRGERRARDRGVMTTVRSHSQSGRRVTVKFRIMFSLARDRRRMVAAAAPTSRAACRRTGIRQDLSVWNRMAVAIPRYVGKPSISRAPATADHWWCCPARWTTQTRSTRVKVNSSRSTTMAMPCPPPTHMVSSPNCLSFVRSAFSSVVVIRAPVMPKGWPSAIAPPCTFNLSGSTPRSRAEGQHLGRECLVDLDEVHVVDRHPG